MHYAHFSPHFAILRPYYVHLVIHGQVYSIFTLCYGSGTCASLVIVINNSPALFLQTNNANDEVAKALLLLTCVLALHRRAPQLPDAQGECLNIMYSKLSFVNPNVGYPLTQFCDLVELLGAFRDAMEGHKQLYYNGLLHRGINPTKILLTGDVRPGNRSSIVDSDDAVCIQDRKILCSTNQIATPAFMSFEMLAGDHYFRTKTARPQQRTQWRRPRRDAAHHVPHAAVHDLESLFWVFCWICATRAGPGTARCFSTAGLSAAAAAEARALQREIDWTIAPPAREGFAMSARRKHVLFDRRAFEEGVLDVGAPYFAPVRPLVVNLYECLRHAYAHRQFEGLHEAFGEAMVITGAASHVQPWHARTTEYRVMERMVRVRRGAGVQESLLPARLLRASDIAVPSMKHGLSDFGSDLDTAELSASARLQTKTNACVAKRTALHRKENATYPEDDADVQDNSSVMHKAGRAQQRKTYALRTRNF